MFVNKIGFLFLIFNHFEACSSDSSTATEKITESSSSSSLHNLEPPYGIILIDTTKECVHNLDGNITSQSKTEYVFATERTSIVEKFTKPSIIISAYYEEKGLQFSGSDEIASRNIAYLLVSESGYKYSGWICIGKAMKFANMNQLSLKMSVINTMENLWIIKRILVKLENCLYLSNLIY